MSSPFRTTRRVEFSDTDMAGIMHFGAFFRMMEGAEHEFLRHVGLSVVTDDAAGRISWPRVAASCDFRSPVRFEDVLDIEVRVAKLGEKSVTYSFQFTHAGRDVATGQMSSVCCRIVADGNPTAIPVPDAIAEKLKG